MWVIPTHVNARSVAYVLVTTVSSAKAAEPMAMPNDRADLCGPRNLIVDGGSNPLGKGTYEGACARLNKI